MKTLLLKETELVNLIKRVINEQDDKDKSINLHIATMFAGLYAEDEDMANDLADCVKETARVHQFILNPQTILPPGPGLIVPTTKVTGIQKEQTLNEESSGHKDLMDGIDKMCIDKPWDNEKMVGNRSCRRCHAPIIDLIKDYCGSFPSEEETYLDDPGQTGVPSIKHQIAQKESVKRLIQRVITEHSGGKLKFNKQSRKKGAKTDVYNVVKGGTTIGQVKWYSRLRGYGFVPPSGDESEVTEFVKEISKTHREKNKKNKKK